MLELDHIVHFINHKPREAVEIFQSHDFNAVMGGHHEKWGTYNSLLYIGLTYLEFLAIEHDEVARNSDNPLIKQITSDLPNGEGLVQICFRTSNITELKNGFDQKGFKTSEIFDGSRKRDDGKIIRWKMLFVHDESDLPLPFFIEWEQTNQERFQDLSELGMISSKLEHIKVQSISFKVTDLHNTVEKWSYFFEKEAHFFNDMKSATIHVGGSELVFHEEIALNQKDNRPYQVTFEPNLFQNPLTLFGATYY